MKKSLVVFWAFVTLFLGTSAISCAAGDSGDTGGDLPPPTGGDDTGDNSQTDGGKIDVGGGGDTPSPTEFIVGGTGTGLLLKINDGETLTITANGSFAFPTPLPASTGYTVAVGNQPDNPSQLCTLKNETGTVTTANVTDIAVTCVTKSYRLGGSVSG